ncbi:hypothetical protein AB0H00_26305 [Nocardia sp. NPDC023852]|uniref:hypothetical protein n=1 Tax=Nocardia sp. NPDC023852 TaxID=3154697 RepID=UPI0033F041C9
MSKRSTVTALKRVVVGYHPEEAITDCDSAFGHDGEHVRPVDQHAAHPDPQRGVQSPLSVVAN